MQFNMIFYPNIDIQLRKSVKYKVTTPFCRRKEDVECTSSLSKSLLIDSLNMMKSDSE